MFSVVIPLYNKQDQIYDTLKSVLNQTYHNFEIVIVNDGSTDRSIAIVSQIKDSRIRIVEQENSGVSAARNMGIREARFDWVAFLDADDLWDSLKLERIREAIYKAPEIIWLFSGYRMVIGSRAYDRTYRQAGFFVDTLDALNDGLTIHTSTVVVKRCVFNEDDSLYFPLGVNNSEDREVWYRLIFKYPSAYNVPETLVDYVIDRSGKSLNTGSVGNFEFLKLKDRISDSLNKLPVERRDKFIIFLTEFNRRVCWRLWVRMGWKADFRKALSVKEERILSYFSSYPKIVRYVIFKLVSSRF